MLIVMFLLGLALVVFARTSDSELALGFGREIIILGVIMMISSFAVGAGLMPPSSECGSSWGARGAESDC